MDKKGHFVSNYFRRKSALVRSKKYMYTKYGVGLDIFYTFLC